MKKLFALFLLAVLFIIAMPPPIYSDTTTPVVSEVVDMQSTDEAYIASGTMSSIDEHFYTFAAFVAIIPFVTEALKALLGATGFLAQLLSWITGILLSLAAWFLNIPGIFEALIWWQVIIVGFAGSLAANSLFDTGLITYILEKLGILKTT